MNRIALITGGSRGLGKDMALRLAQSGCDAIVTYRSKLAEANNVVSQIEQIGQTAAALQFDVGKIITFDGFIQELQTLLKTKFNAEKLTFSSITLELELLFPSIKLQKKILIT